MCVIHPKDNPNHPDTFVGALKTPPFPSPSFPISAGTSRACAFALIRQLNCYPNREKASLLLSRLFPPPTSLHPPRRPAVSQRCSPSIFLPPDGDDDAHTFQTKLLITQLDFPSFLLHSSSPNLPTPASSRVESFARLNPKTKQSSFLHLKVTLPPSSKSSSLSCQVCIPYHEAFLFAFSLSSLALCSQLCISSPSCTSRELSIKTGCIAGFPRRRFRFRWSDRITIPRVPTNSHAICQNSKNIPC